MGQPGPATISNDAETAFVGQRFSITCGKAPCGSSALLKADELQAITGRSLMLSDRSPVDAQWLDMDGDEIYETLFVADPQPDFVYQAGDRSAPQVKARAQVVLSVREGGTWDGSRLRGGSFQDRSEVVFPKEYAKDNALIRMEGPAWESEKVGYRLYLDQRNGTDIFGKSVTDLVLQSVGFDDDDYHAVSAWGADVLKVGDSLGIGAIGLMQGGRAKRLAPQGDIKAEILRNGPLVATVSVLSGAVTHEAGKIDITTEYSINAGSRMTHVKSRSDAPIAGWATGIVRHPPGELIQSAGDDDWQYIATFGPQSVFDDMLGMAVFFRGTEATYFADDPLSHVIKFSGTRGQVSYHMSAVWGRDVDAIQTKQDFILYLESERALLGQSAQVVLLQPEH